MKKSKGSVVHNDRPRISALDGRGHEVPDSRPAEIPVHFQAPMPLNERIRQMVKSEALRIKAMEAGMETFEEADDFDVGDDFDPASPYEVNFDQSMAAVPERPNKMPAMKEEPPKEPVPPLEPAPAKVQ